MACPQAGIEALLVHFLVPLADRKRVRTTKAIERAFREVRRRTRPLSCYSGPASIAHIMFAVFVHLRINWVMTLR